MDLVGANATVDQVCDVLGALPEFSNGVAGYFCIENNKASCDASRVVLELGELIKGDTSNKTVSEAVFDELVELLLCGDYKDEESVRESTRKVVEALQGNEGCRMFKFDFYVRGEKRKVGDEEGDGREKKAVKEEAVVNSLQGLVRKKEPVVNDLQGLLRKKEVDLKHMQGLVRKKNVEKEG
jgi:hypothetical protein